MAGNKFRRNYTAKKSQGELNPGQGRVSKNQPEKRGAISNFTLEGITRRRKRMTKEEGKGTV